MSAKPIQEKSQPIARSDRLIGSILVDQGSISPKDSERIQQYAREHQIRFGDAALRLNLLTERDIDTAIARQFNYPILPRGNELGGVADAVVAAYDPLSERVESLRALRSHIALRWQSATSTRKILAVTSPERAEGRSWLAANLATVFAQLGERTLLIDADMRHPSQHKLFNLDNSVGLSALLTGRAGREIVTRVDPLLRLFVVAAGIRPPNPQELLARPVFSVVLDLFADQYETIIIDTPAATQTSDAQIIAARAGGALMVVRRNHTRRARLLESMKRFSETGVSVLGTVCNEY